MAGKPIRISILGDARDVKQAAGETEDALTHAATVADKAAAKIDGSFSTTAEGADNVASKGSQAAGALSGLGDLAAQQGGKMGILGTAMMTTGIAAQAAADAGDLLNVVTESSIVKNTLAKAATIGKAVAERASAVATKAYAAAQWLLNAALDANPIGLLVIALAALVVGIIVAYKKSDKFREIVDKAFGKIKEITEKVIPKVKEIITGTWEAIKTATDKAWGFVKDKIVNPIKNAKETISTTVDSIKTKIGNIWDDIKTKTDNVYNGIKDKVTGKFKDIVAYITGIPAALVGLGDKFKDAGSKLIGKLIHGLSSVGGSVVDIGAAIVNSVIDFLNRVLPHEISINKGPIHVHVPLFPTIPHVGSGGSGGGAGTGGTSSRSVTGGDTDLTGTSTGRAGNTYNLTVNAPVGSSPADIGRVIVAHIDAYESAGGGRRAK